MKKNKKCVRCKTTWPADKGYGPNPNYRGKDPICLVCREEMEENNLRVKAMDKRNLAGWNGLDEIYC